MLLLGYGYNRSWCLNIGDVSFSSAKNLPVIDNLFEMLRLSPAPSKELSEQEGSVEVVQTALHLEEEILITNSSSSTKKKKCQNKDLIMKFTLFLIDRYESFLHIRHKDCTYHLELAVFVY